MIGRMNNYPDIDGPWIKAQLTKRGQQAKLARALGINNDKMSKTIRGIREVQVNEVIPILVFFGYTILPPDDELRLLIEEWRELAKEDQDALRRSAKGLRAQPHQV